jgi:hypothetical protein
VKARGLRALASASSFSLRPLVPFFFLSAAFRFSAFLPTFDLRCSFTILATLPERLERSWSERAHAAFFPASRRAAARRARSRCFARSKRRDLLGTLRA